MEDLPGAVSVGAKLRAHVMLRIANQAVYERLEAARTAGVPVPVVVEDTVKFELPDGRVVSRQELKQVL